MPPEKTKTPVMEKPPELVLPKEILPPPKTPTVSQAPPSASVSKAILPEKTGRQKPPPPPPKGAKPTKTVMPPPPKKAPPKPPRPPMPIPLKPEYDSLNAEFTTLSEDESKHAKRQKLIELRDKKAALDAKLQKESQGNPTHTLIKEAETGKEQVESAEAEVTPRVERAIRTKEGIQNKADDYQMIVKLVNHVGGKTIEENAKTDIQRQDEATAKVARDAKEEKKENRFAMFDFLQGAYTSIVGHVGDINDMVEVGDTAKKYMGSTSDFIQKGKEGLKEKSVGNISGYMSMVGALIGTGISVASIIKQIVSGFKAKGSMDNQEATLRKRKFITSIVDVVNGVIDFFSPFTALVPFLGVSLSMLKNVLSLGASGMELVFDIIHASSIRKNKRELWARIQAKKNKYLDKGDTESAALYSLAKESDSEVNLKKRDLLAQVATDMNASVPGATVYNKNVQGKDGWFGLKKTKDHGFSKVSEDLTSKIAEERDKYHAKKQSAPEKAAYKKKMHKMEALQMIQEYEVFDKAQERMQKKTFHDSEDIVTTGITLIGNGIDLIGQVTTATGIGAQAGAAIMLTGKIVKGSVSGYETARSVGSFAHSKYDQHSVHGANKTFIRNEMAVSLYERMNQMSKISWVSGDLKNIPDIAKDYHIKSTAHDLNYLLSVRTGLDMYVSSILQAPSKAAIIDSLSKAFSQDGNE